ATLGVLGLAGLRRATSTAALGAVLTLLATPVGFHLPWPALPLIGLGIAVIAGLTAALLPPDRWRGLPWACRVVWPIAGAVGLASCLATSTTTLVGLGVATAAGFVAAAAGRGVAGRQTGWVVTGASAALLAHSAGVEAQLGPELAPYLVLGVAVMLLAASAGLPAVRRGSESRVVEWLSYGSAGFAALLGAAAPATTAAVLAGYGALLGLSGLRPGRLRLVIGAAGCELLAWWIFLFQQSVGLAEAYTLPLALAALVGGVIEMRRRPQLSSWRGYGVALAAGFLPSMTVVASGDAEPVRRLALGVAALAVLLIGVARRRQAPVAFGGAVLALVALWELAQLWELVPRWLPLALAGLLLVALGATYEQRRRDLRRLRQAMARMR
ncbi:MAG: SCO7613 C-terminal domain-containing membrane protein, partial [Micromonosporaceae bacterium]